MRKSRPLEMIPALTNVKRLIDLKKAANFQQCMQIARDKFDRDHDHAIRDLQALFPQDHTNEDGQPFWSGPKRYPTACAFNADDQLSMDYVVSCANLIAFNLGIPEVRDEAQLNEFARSTTA
jgi:ubiquitin-activating enzyme E1